MLNCKANVATWTYKANNTITKNYQFKIQQNSP